MNVKPSATVSDDKWTADNKHKFCYKKTHAGGCWLLCGFVNNQFPEPSGDDEYEVCDPNESEYLNK